MSSTNSTPTELREGAADLFPLRLSPFERYMLQDDSRSYPMSFVLIVNLTGNLVREAFEQAMLFAVKRHPLLMSLVGRIPGNGLCWIPLANPVPEIDWREEAHPPQDRVQERINLTREAGVRARVDRINESADVLFEFHHACTDGLGGIQFIGDLLARYAQLTAPEGAELPEMEEVHVDRLRLRTNFLTTESEQPSKSVSSPFLVGRRLWKLLWRKPVSLVSGRQKSTGTPLAFPAMISRIIAKVELQELKVAAAKRAVELNDLYMGEMFQTIREWHRSQGRDLRKEWLRIGMPTSLRTPLHDGMPAANVVSYMFLTRRAEECDHPEELLAGIHRQTSRIVNERLGQIAASILKYVQLIPGLMWCLLRLNSCFCTAVLANVGEIRRQFKVRFPLNHGRCVAGNVILEAVMGSPPVRPNTRLTISLGTYGGRLFINLHCDPLCFSREQAEHLADLFVGRLRQISSTVSLESKAA